MSENEISQNFNTSAFEEANPIVIQLQEFGYDKIYSRRVLYYFHPEDIEDALNYMAIENGIIQHRFIPERNAINNICHICGENRNIHLNELNNSIDSESEKIKNEEKNNNNEVASGISVVVEANIKKIVNSECRFEKIRNEFLSGEAFDINLNNKKVKNKSFVNTDIVNLNLDGEIKECEICNELFTVNENNRLENCGHAFCLGCWYDYLSVMIKENKLSSIKCLNYDCKEKLSDDFTINLLRSNKSLIKKYKKYKLELEIMNDPNKKLCPYPNCDSYLELKNIRNKDVTCKNNHTYCFECLKKPHGNLPCDGNMDNSIIEYAMNNFVKKCPQCSIITEKNNGCNHITCTKCGYQWCWLCNEKYDLNHFDKSKCKGFQFFQPKNEYDIKLMMEGKINVSELSNSQRQIDDDFIINDNQIHRLHIRHHILRRMMGIEEMDDEDNYNRINCKNKACYVLFFIFFGNHFLILKGFDNIYNNFISIIILILLYIPFIFQFIFLNILSLLVMFISIGFRRFIVEFIHLENLYIKKIVLIIVNVLFATFFLCFSLWKRLIDDTLISNRYYIKFLLFFPCAIMSIIIYYPQRILINIIGIIITYIYKGSFSRLLHALEQNFERAFNFWLNQL